MKREAAPISSISESVISSDIRGRRRSAGAVASALAVLCLLAPTSGRATVFLTVDEALALAFPDCEVERETLFLTGEQRGRAEDLAGTEIPSGVVHPYRATCDGEERGTAYFEVHRVRTLPETLMVVVDPDGAVERIELLAFREPPDYIPRDRWYEQFLGRELDEDLQMKRQIQGVTGATLTARATTDAVRRILALHRVLFGESSREGDETGSEGEP